MIAIMTWLTVTQYQCKEWPLFSSVCRNHNLRYFYLFMYTGVQHDFHIAWFTFNNTTHVIIGIWTAYCSEAPEFISGFYGLCFAQYMYLFFGILILVFNATFSNISAISWRPFLVVEEYPERTTDPGQATGKLLSLAATSQVHLLCNLQSWARTHADWW